MDILYEYRLHPTRQGKVRLMTREAALAKGGGFISVCGYGPSVAESIDETNSTFGLDSKPLFVEWMILDFDDAPEDYAKSLKTCEENNWEYIAYSTGNRGHHVYIKIDPIHEVGAYLRLSVWASSNFQGYDNCLYKSSSITRIPGTFHSKTGKQMLEVARGGSTQANVRIADAPFPKIAQKADEPGEEEDLASLFAVMLEKRISSGERHGYAFKLAALGYDAGTSDESLEELLKDWNTNKCSPPITGRALTHAINSAKRRRA